MLLVLGRSQGAPPVCSARSWVDSSKWTAWQKVPLDIKSDHVLPLVWNGKQYIFWAITTVKADQHDRPKTTTEGHQVIAPARVDAGR